MLMKKAVMSLSMVAMVWGLCASAVAAPPTLSEDGLKTIGAPTVPAQMHVPSRKLAGMVDIYSNFNADPNAAYQGGIGWTVSAAGSVAAARVESAAAFTPSQNYMAKMATVAVGLVQGTNAVSVKLHADAGGLPGAVLKTAQTTALPSFGSCCVTVSFNVNGPGVPLTGGTQYWVSVSTTKKGSDTWAAWNLNNIANQGTFAQRIDGNSWSAFWSDMPAFSVHGN